MRTSHAGHKRMPGQWRDAANRRSLLTLIAVTVGALSARPAWAHHVLPLSAAQPVPVPPRSSNIAGAASLADLKKIGVEHQVLAIRHGGGSYRVVTADGRSVDFPETGLRFKVDSSAMGPFRGKPVIVPAGQVGDRAQVFFAAPGEIGSFIEQQS